MDIKVKVNWKFKVNGKEYGSVEEMPAEVREAYQKAKGMSQMRTAKIVFNSKEYESIEAMPEDVRRVYDKVMRAAETGDISSGVLSEAEYRLTAPDRGGVSLSHRIPRPIEPESTFSLSSRTLAVGLALLLLLLGLYFVIAG